MYAKETQQSECFRQAAEKGGYHITLKRNSEGALESYLEQLHDVVLVDTRHTKHFDAEALCRWVFYSHKIFARLLEILWAIFNADNTGDMDSLINREYQKLTHWGLVTPFGDMDLGQHWLR